MHRSIRSFNNPPPPGQPTDIWLTSVPEKEENSIKKAFSWVGNLNLAPGGVGHLNGKYEFESEVSSPFSRIHELFFEIE